MWVCVLLHFALRSIGRQEVDFIPYLRSITLFPFGELRPNQIWTLRHEAFFYFFAGMCLVAKPWRIVLGAFVLLPLVLPNSWVSITEPNFQSTLGTILSSRPNIGFGMGLLIGWLYRDKNVTLISHRMGIVISVLSPIILLCWAASARHLEITGLFYVISTSLICALIVYCVLGVLSPTFRVGRYFMTIGAASYAIYLTHDAFISAVAGIMSKLGIPWLVYPTALVMVFVVVGMGIGLHLFLETRVVELSRRFMQKSMALRTRVS